METNMTNDITDSQKAFAAAIEGKVGQMLSSRLDGTFNVLNYPSGFDWQVKKGSDAYYNSKSLNEIDLGVTLGGNGIHTLGGSNFSTMYRDILVGASYVYSTQDSATITKHQKDASAAEVNVIEEWESAVGQISQSQQKDAFPPTKIGFISEQVEKKWGGDAGNIPVSMNNFRIAWQTYQVAAAASFSILTRASQAAIQRKAAIENVEKPTESNKGMQVSSSQFYPGFTGLPTVTTINNGLQTETNTVSVDIDISNFSSEKSNLSIDGKVGFSIPIADIVTFDIGASSSYHLDKYKESSSSLSMNISYPGVTVVGSAPMNLSADGSTGWYSDLIIGEIVKAVTEENVTGYKLGSSSEFTHFGDGSKFSRVKTFVISQQPTITMTFAAADSNLVTSDFKESASLKVKLFGLFDVGSVSQSYEVKKVDASSEAGKVTVTLGPPTEDPGNTAYIMGGVISAPSAN